MIRRKPELLAPAGGMKQLTAAVENGADAVYLGGPLFNARINADNFTEEELQTAIDYAHLRGVKIHITLNTLLRDEELLPALQYAGRLYDMGADALIVQDLGLIDLLREYLPDFPLHLSTQGSVYNLSGVRNARSLGISRVVLARELSLEEIREITAGGGCDIEVFVHGALCMCYSGQCQMSRVLGGGDRSGNRGLCAQPCRLPYASENHRHTYALSPKDLCTIDYLGELTEAGVSSLKIEGRMKSPEYVAAVTGIYRKYLDLYWQQGHYRVAEEDRQILMQIFNRGGFTAGYLKGNPGKKLLSGQLPKHQGVFIGKVQRKVSKSQLIDVQLEKPLAMGDGIEIRSRQLTGNVVTYLRPQKGGFFRIGDIKGEVAAGDPIYKITDGALMKQLRKTFEEGGPQGGKHRRTVPVGMRLEVRIGRPPQLTVKHGDEEVCVTEEDVLAEPAIHKALSREAAEAQLRKTGGTPFAAGKVEVDIEENSTLPLSALNRLRRCALQALEERKKLRRTSLLPKALDARPQETHKRLAFYFYRGKSLVDWDFQDAIEIAGPGRVRAYVPLKYFMAEKPWANGVEVIPYVLNISKGRLDRYIEENFDEIVERVRPCGIALGSLGWSQEFSSRGVTIYADYGLNLYNSKAQEAAARLNFRPASLSHELWNLSDGPIPLMISEHLMEEKSLKDRKGQAYKIVYNEENDKILLFPIIPEKPSKSLKSTYETASGEVRVYVP